ncbi:TPA: hypothetical protein BOS_9853 [Bos taurus]|nr:TPA: hypothetical protein BOS_9853 [Bos taurus]
MAGVFTNNTWFCIWLSLDISKYSKTTTWGVLQVAGWSSWKSRVWVMSALSHIPGHDNSMTRVTTEESQDNEWNQTMRGAKINWANTPTVQNGLVPGHHPCEHPAP